MRHGLGYHARVARRELARCEICQGRGVTQGIFHKLECEACDGTGLVDAESGARLEPREMIAQLLIRLDAAGKVCGGVPGGPGMDYVGRTNSHHRGGGNWTGD
jgi:RecJ-like exonuclease